MASKGAAVLLTVPGPDGDREVRLTSADRVVFPDRGITKGEVVEYYRAVAEPLQRVLFERPTNLKRYSHGVDGEPFYSKRLPKGAPEYVETAEVTFPSGRKAQSFCPTEPAVLVWAANMGTFDFHPWPVRRDDLDHPDELRVDLDPQPGTDFSDARVAAGYVHELLDELGWTGWPKTSGGRGIHIFVRIEPDWVFTDVRRAALAFARELERRAPDLLTTKWWKEERGEQIFIDYNQNARDRTIASAYSIRASTGLVSAPISWDELPEVRMQDFTMATMPARFAELGDLHAGIDEAVFRIGPLLEWADRDARDGAEEPPEDDTQDLDAP